MTTNAAQLETIQSHNAVLHRPIWDRPELICSPSAGSRQTHLGDCCTKDRPHSDIDSEISKWTGSRTKRLIDFSAALLLLLLLAPVFCILYIFVRTGSRGPAIFKQERVGQSHSRFKIYKFRTMLHASGGVSQLRSKQHDSRLTAQGSVLRNYKFDELPQLVNVLRGEMSLVGPRPLLPEHSAGELHCRPGLTGRASIAFAREAKLVENVPEHLLEEFHATFITPLKRQLDQDYMRTASLMSDLGILWRTISRQGRYRNLAALDDYAENTSMDS